MRCDNVGGCRFDGDALINKRWQRQLEFKLECGVMMSCAVVMKTHALARRRSVIVAIIVASSLMLCRVRLLS